MKKLLSKSLDDTRRIARDWLGSLPKKEDEAIVIGLSGNLGSGKTAFVQALAAELGVAEQVTSPTFVIEKIYLIGSNGGNDPQGSVHPEVRLRVWSRLVHIDAYRLESARELEVLNFEELVDDPNNLILIEWPENVREILPESTLTIKCEFVSETERSYEFE
ncbi:MAG: tRNA (adenosine(37)-N6)-threonylcarbamoyltransferase complex ATPase subunit type 1 TsaE [Patescibacteria group bacterium]|nr:tRNA (adenosine(37)-N6)-threonylcarbamoyltransferase complex ATPase subunit type 1 TsaE [Patescibacteria group bacterium]